MMGQICEYAIQKHFSRKKSRSTFDQDQDQLYRGGGEKKAHVFLQSFNLPNVYLQGLSMAEGLLRFLLCCESGINKYDGQ